MSSLIESEAPQPEEFAAYLEGGLFPGGFPLSSHSNAYEKSRVVKSGAGRLFGLSGYNSGAAQFVLLFDAATLPADGAVPIFPIAAAATSTFGAYWGSVGRWFYQGIVICNSSTGPTKTIGAADCFWDIQFI